LLLTDLDFDVSKLEFFIPHGQKQVLGRALLVLKEKYVCIIERYKAITFTEIESN